MFNSGDKIAIARILKVSLSDVDARIVYLGELITPELVAAVQIEINRWDSGAGSDFISIEPTATNFGTRINPQAAQDDIRQNIAVLLDFISHGGFGNSSSLRLQRA